MGCSGHVSQSLNRMHELTLVLPSMPMATAPPPEIELNPIQGESRPTAWAVCGTDDEAKQFLGPLADEFLTFADPTRSFVKGLELTSLPAFLHIDHALNVVNSAEGWNPKEWRTVAKELSKQMSWSSPSIPDGDDPPPYPGTPALG